MPWPQAFDYNSAIQEPSACFADADMARGQPAEGMLPGIPLSYAGNFATVYKINSPSGFAWAVKCFTRQVDNLQERYKEICAHLNRRKRRFVVDFQYLPEGIRVCGNWYPVVKMQWVEGFTLNEFLRHHAGNAAILEQLCQLWLRLGNEMREDRIAHGDLQHGNVLLVPGTIGSSMLLRLVDYDGMWVPTLADLPPGEVGHANYQHPERLAEGGYDEHVDRFAHLAVYTALRCLMVGGMALWNSHDTGENILFREADFKHPTSSKLFAKLQALPDTDATALAGHLLLASQGAVPRVPLVSDLLAGTGVVPLSAEQILRVRALVPLSAQVAVSPGTFVPSWPGSGPIVPGSPVAMVALPAESLILDAPPVAAVGKDSVRVGSLHYQVVPLAEEPPPLPPLPKAMPIGTIPPAPEWFQCLGLPENGLAVRLWPVTLATLAMMVLAPTLILAVWMIGKFERRGEPLEPEPVPPRLARMAPVTLRAGHELEVNVEVERESTDVPLIVWFVELPRGVTFEARPLAPGDGPARLSVRLCSAPDTAGFTGDVIVRLNQGDEQLDEQQIHLTVKPFIRPELDVIPPLTIEAGESQRLEVCVKSNGNDDPWKLDLRGLPEGVTFRAPPGSAPNGMVAVLVEAGSAAPAKNGAIIEVVLLADGVLADSRLVSLSVEPIPRNVKIDLVVSKDIQLPLGGTTTLSVEMIRHGYRGPIQLEIIDLPVGVTTCGPVRVAAGAVRAKMELRAGTEIASRLALQDFRVAARVHGKLVGTRQGTFRLERPAEPGKLKVRGFTSR
jgi:hypothetical protein